MDKFGMHELRELTEPREGPCVTICLPTHVAGADEQQDIVRLKNLADQAERQLAADWLRAPEARDLLAELRNLPADHGFWNARSHGLALYLESGALRRYRVPLRLDELAIVNRRFHVKPLLPLLTSGDRFFILVLSQNDVRLLAATQFEVEQVEVAGLPRRMDEALQLDGADRGSQSHFAMRGGKGKQSSVFHGQGGIADTHKDELAQYFRLIDGALAPVLRDERAPLLLAGVEYLLPIFRESCRYPQLAQPVLAGNWDHLSARQVHEKVWPLAQPMLTAARDQALDKFRRLAGTGKTSDDIRQALPAAVAGRVESLFVTSNSPLWGRCDAEGQVTELHEQAGAGDEDLTDTAAVETLLHGGSVYSLDREAFPTPEPLAAVMRF